MVIQQKETEQNSLTFCDKVIINEVSLYTFFKYN